MDFTDFTDLMKAFALKKKSQQWPSAFFSVKSVRIRCQKFFNKARVSAKPNLDLNTKFIDFQ